MALEINFIAFLPLTCDNIYSEGTVLYFIVQCFFSQVFICIVVFFWLCYEYQENILLIALSSKIGLPPVHKWYIKVVRFFSWETNIVLIVLQKWGPLHLLSQCIWGSSLFLLYGLIILSRVIGSSGAFINRNLFTVIAYSSVSHMSWMCVGILVDWGTWWILYFLIYGLVSVPLLLAFGKFSIGHISSLYIINSFDILPLWINFIRVGGLPPTLGFFGKLFLINNIVINGIIGLVVFLVVVNLISVYLYFRITWNIMIVSNVIYKPMRSTMRVFRFDVFLIFLNFMSFIFIPLI